MIDWQIQTGPIVEPLTLTQAKQQLRLDSGFTDDDSLVTGLISAAREIAEKYTRRAFFNQTWVLSLDSFPLWNYASGTVNPATRKAFPFYSSFWDPLAIRLPKPRCLRVLSITYVDVTNTQQTIDPSSYVVDTSSEPARIVPLQPFVWPTTLLYIPGSVKVTFEAASYVQAASQQVTVPVASPYQNQLDGTTVTAVSSVLNGSTPVTGWTFTSAGMITFPAANAGQALSVSYSTANCPQSVLAALYLLLNDLYENRLPAAVQPAGLPQGIKNILDLHSFEQFTYENGN